MSSVNDFDGGSPALASFHHEVIAVERLLGSSFAEQAHLRDRIEQLQAELGTRDLLEQAQGIIMGRLDITEHEALGLLTAGAGSDDAKLSLVAAAVVAARRTPAEIAASLLAEDDSAPKT